MRFLSCLAVALFVLSGLVPMARAEEPKEIAPWGEVCRHYRSPRHFVTESTLYCFRRTDQKRCQSEAAAYFERCRFAGDFQKMSARMGARMLIVLALTSVRSVHHIDL
jgi:hypothetical protein